MSEKNSDNQNDHSQDKRPGCAKCCNYMCCCCVFTGRMMVKCVGPYLRKISDSTTDTFDKNFGILVIISPIFLSPILKILKFFKDERILIYGANWKGV